VSNRLGESFVIWLDPDLRPGELRGVVEHVASGRRERFESESGLGRILRARAGTRERAAPSFGLGRPGSD
jgi:hypothetical protein